MTWRRTLSLLGSPWVVGVVVAVGTVGLLLPLLLAPVTSDSRYHYLAAPERFDDSLLGVLPWTINDIQWRLEAGRFAPFGVFVQHVLYYVGMKLALVTGMEVYLAEAVIKVGLLAAVVLCFRALLRRLRGPGGQGLARLERDVGTVVFGALLVAGVTTVSPGRNGWVTFVVLCIGGCVLLLGLGALALSAVSRLQARATGRVTLAVVLLGLVVAGALVVISYEMHWAAYPFAVILALAQGRDLRLWRRQAGDGARWAVAVALSIGFWSSFAATRWLVRTYADNVYTGLDVDLDGPVVRTAVLQLVNAIPGTGVSLVRHDTRGTALTPEVFGGFGWVYGVCLGVGTWLWLRRISARPPEVAPSLGQAAAERSPGASPLIVLSVAAVVSAVAAALVLSVSEQAHEIVERLGNTYRGTPWIWTCMAVAVTCVLLMVRRGSGRLGRAVMAVPVVAALVAGGVVWPANVAAVRELRNVDSYALFELVQREMVTGSDDPAAKRLRCDLDVAAREWGTTSYRRGYRTIYTSAFEHQWGRPFCIQQTG